MVQKINTLTQNFFKNFFVALHPPKLMNVHNNSGASSQAQSRRSKYWVFTINNPTREDTEAIAVLCENGKASYVVYGRERGDQEGTPHYQGYAEFTSKIQRGRACRLLGGRASVQPRRGTGTEARDYCLKEGDYVEFGTFREVQQGQRSDLESIRLRILAGDDQKSIADDHFATWCFHRKAFQEYRQLHHNNGIRLDLQVVLLWGEAGTGKTRYCYDKHTGLYRTVDPELKWFDGYDGQDVVLIDDYRADCRETLILQYLDVYPVTVPVKGGFRPFTPKLIYITTNIKPSDLHNFQNPASREAWRRRIHKCVKFEFPMNTDEVDERIETFFNWE